jgi:hypothetical protein
MGAKFSAMECHGIPWGAARPAVFICVHPRSSAVKFAFAEAGLAAAHAVFRQKRIQPRMNADERRCARAVWAVWPMVAKGESFDR